MTLGQYVALSVILISIAMAGALAYDGPFWASSSQAVPVALAGGAMGLINALGNLGGFAGPYMGGWPQDASGGRTGQGGMCRIQCMLTWNCDDGQAPPPPPPDGLTDLPPMLTWWGLGPRRTREITAPNESPTSPRSGP